MIFNAIKLPRVEEVLHKAFFVQEGDATMITIAVYLPGPKNVLIIEFEQ